MSKTVGQEIAKARRARDLTQTELGERLDTSGAYVAKVETGRANLTLGQLAAFADALSAGLVVQLPLIERQRVKLRDPYSRPSADRPTPPASELRPTSEITAT